MTGYRFGSHQGCVGGVSLQQIIAAAHLHNPSRCAAKTSSVYSEGGRAENYGGQIFGLWQSYCKRESGGHLACNYLLVLTCLNEISQKFNFLCMYGFPSYKNLRKSVA